MTFRHLHEVSAKVEEARVTDGPHASKKGELRGLFAMNLDKNTQLQVETKQFRNREILHAKLVSRKGRTMPIGVPLLRQIRTWFWPDSCTIVTPIGPLIEGEVELDPYLTTLINESDTTTGE